MKRCWNAPLLHINSINDNLDLIYHSDIMVPVSVLVVKVIGVSIATTFLRQVCFS